MNQANTSRFLLLLILIFVCANCTTNHQQQDFRRQALSTPKGIQEMTAAGKHKPGDESDSSDWRTAPGFSGLFEVVTPAYPNPVPYNSTLTIQVFVKGLNAINTLKIYAFRQPADLRIMSPIQIIPSSRLHHGILLIKIKPSKFTVSSGAGNFGNVYRILFMDGHNRIITYGDVRVK